MAVDTLGRMLTWHGQRFETGRDWSWPEPISRVGLQSVSCPSASFCVAVDGAGHAVMIRGEKPPAPVPDRPHGHRPSSRCPAPRASFCVASDWNGDVITFNGRSLVQAPAAGEKTTGFVRRRPLGDISCPTARFCIASGLERQRVHLERRHLDHKHAFNPDGAGGLISVSCRSASFCMAVDGSGDALTWNGASWHSCSPIDPTRGRDRVGVLRHDDVLRGGGLARQRADLARRPRGPPRPSPARA